MSASETSCVQPSYRHSYEEHKDQLLNLIQQTNEELCQFQKWGAKEDEAADIARDFSSYIRDTAEMVNRNMRSAAEKRKALEALEFPLDELGYPSDNELVEDESNSATGKETIINHHIGTSEFPRIAERIKIEDESPSASSLWKGKEKEVNPSEHVADTEIPPATSRGKGKEPEVPYRFPFTRSAGESSHRRLDDSASLTAPEDDILNCYIILIEKLFKFHASWGSEDIGKHFLKGIAREMQDTAEEIQKRTGRIPSVDNSLALGSDHETTANCHTRTSESRNMPSQSKGEATTSEGNLSERKPPQCKIIIPARRPVQLPPREMRKSKKLLDCLQFDSDVDDELEGEVKEEEEPFQIESISQAHRPVEGRERYNLRSASKKKIVAEPSRKKDEPIQAARKRSKKEDLKSRASKRADGKRYIKDEEESSRKSKKRCREDEAEKGEIKKESLNMKRKRNDDNVNEEAKARKRSKGN